MLCTRIRHAALYNHTFLGSPCALQLARMNLVVKYLKCSQRDLIIGMDAHKQVVVRRLCTDCSRSTALLLGQKRQYRVNVHGVAEHDLLQVLHHHATAACVCGGRGHAVICRRCTDVSGHRGQTVLQVPRTLVNATNVDGCHVAKQSTQCHDDGSVVKVNDRAEAHLDAWHMLRSCVVPQGCRK